VPNNIIKRLRSTVGSWFHNSLAPPVKNADHEQAVAERHLASVARELIDSCAKDIMTHRNETLALNTIHDSRAEIMRFLTKLHANPGPHPVRTLIPVYEGTIDAICGYITVHDLIEFALLGSQVFAWNHKICKAIFVAPSMGVIDLFIRMKKTGVYMAVVLDEYGGTDGLVFLDNIIDLLVGDDESVNISGDQFEVNGRIELDTLQDLLGLNLTNEDMPDDIETLGGLILFLLGRVPNIDEVIEHNSGLVFTIKDAGARSINRVLVDKSRLKHR
jgi:magnesium and cobalt transporter